MLKLKQFSDVNFQPSKNGITVLPSFALYLRNIGFIWPQKENSLGVPTLLLKIQEWGLLFLFARYVTDIINMLQGVYIFIIFVCKRNVFDLLLNRARRGGQTTNSNRANRVINAMTKKKNDKEKMELESMSGGHSNTTHMTEG